MIIHSKLINRLLNKFTTLKVGQMWYSGKEVFVIIDIRYHINLNRHYPIIGVEFMPRFINGESPWHNRWCGHCFFRHWEEVTDDNLEEMKANLL